MARPPEAVRVISDHTAIDLRCERLVDRKLGLAGGFALVERRIIEEREFDRALNLQDAIAGKKHRCAMGVDARCRNAAMCRWIGQKLEYFVL